MSYLLDLLRLAVYHFSTEHFIRFSDHSNKLIHIIKSNYDRYYFIMSFGQHQYQHRFYKQPMYKKSSIFSAPSHSLFPLLPSSNVAVENPRYEVESIPLTNEINLRVRGGNLKRSDPGWQGYKVAAYVTDKYAQDYVANAEMLERFRLEAESYKKQKRRVLRMQPLPRQNRYNTLPEYIENIDQQRVTANPQVNLSTSDVGVMTKLDQLQRSRLQIQNKLVLQKQKQKVEKQKRKYNKLKNRIKADLQKIKMNQVLKQKQMELKRSWIEEQKVKHLQDALSQMNHQLNLNSKLLGQAIRLNEDLRINNRSQSQAEVQQSFEEPQAPELPTQPKTSLIKPQVIYHARDLSRQYDQMEDLTRQISFLSEGKHRRYGH